MSPEQFEEWCVKDQVEPIGYSVQLLGMIAWFLYSYMTVGKGDAKPGDFMPWTKHQPEPKAQNAKMKKIITALAGR